MNSWNVILATVVIFGTGVVTGGLLVNYVERPHPKMVRRAENKPANATHPVEAKTPRAPEMLSKEFVQQLDSALQLTPEQRESIEKIIIAGQEENRAIWSNNAAQVRKEMQDVQHQIREQLTPEQDKQFPELLKQFRASHRTNAPAGMLTNLPAYKPAK